MKAIDLYLKIEVDLPEDEDPRRFADELCRMLARVYAVRRAELTNQIERGKDS